MANQTRKSKKAVKKGMTAKTVEDTVGQALIEARKSRTVERKTKPTT